MVLMVPLRFCMVLMVPLRFVCFRMVLMVPLRFVWCSWFHYVLYVSVWFNGSITFCMVFMVFCMVPYGDNGSFCMVLMVPLRFVCFRMVLMVPLRFVWCSWFHYYFVWC